MLQKEDIECNMNIMRGTVGLVFNPNMVDSFAFLFNCTTIVGVSDSMTAPTYTFHFRLLMTWTSYCRNESNFVDFIDV